MPFHASLYSLHCNKPSLARACQRMHFTKTRHARSHPHDVQSHDTGGCTERVSGVRGTILHLAATLRACVLFTSSYRPCLLVKSRLRQRFMEVLSPDDHGRTSSGKGIAPVIYACVCGVRRRRSMLLRSHTPARQSLKMRPSKTVMNNVPNMTACRAIHCPALLNMRSVSRRSPGD